jgi:glycosyltransferase involved in cell wall biosynthesis
VALLNSDDVFHPERLARCLSVLSADPAAQLVTTGLAVMDSKERRLTGATACVLDLGPSAHGWVQWYERVTAGLTAVDAIALPQLLRHNHLATSSNVVCRTDWLRRQADRCAPLQYCVDWSLFLHAAVEGSLRHVPEALLGYRLHDSNTVWFGDDTRPGYVHEVNAVVADALRAYVGRRRNDGIDGERLAEEVAGLLVGSVSGHGETDGMALVLADLIAASGAVPATFRSPELVRMAQQALAKRTAPRTAGDAAAAVAGHAVAALARQVAALEPRVGRMAHEAAVAGEQREDQVAQRQRLDAALASAAAHEAEAALLRRDLVSTEDRLARTATGLATTQQNLELARTELAALQAELASARAGANRTAAALAETSEKLAATTAELAETTEKLAATTADLASARAAADRTATELAETFEKLAATTAELERICEAHGAAVEAHAVERGDAATRLEDVAHALARVIAERDDAERRAAADVELAERRLREQGETERRLEESLDYRIGRAVLHKSGLGGVVKTLLRLGTGARIGASRLFAGLRKQVPGRKPMRALFACDGAFPDAASLQVATQLLVLRDEGFDARAVCWRRGSPAQLPSALQRAVRGRIVLAKDAALLARDRRWVARRRPEELAALQAFPIAPGALALAFPFARTARSLGAFYVHAEGLGAMAFAVYAAARLVGIHFGLRLRAEDLPSLHAPHWREVVARAAAVLVDGDDVAQGVIAAMGAVPALLVQPPLVPHASRRASPLARNGKLLACIGPFTSPRGLLILADGCKAAIARGVDLRGEVLGGADDSLTNARALDWLRGRLREHGILDRFVIRDGDGERHVAELLARASVAFDAHAPVPHEVAGVSAGTLAALAAGVPVIGFAGTNGSAVRDGKEALLTPFGDGSAMAAALLAVLGDGALQERLGTGARRRYDEVFAPELSAVEFTARLRALRNAARG